VPEGDTIHRLAARLGAVLEGRPVTRVEVARSVPGSPRPPAAGTEVVSVEARGKHLLIRFADRTTLHTHLGMNGRWQCFRDGADWSRRRHRMRAVVAVDQVEAVCFDAPVAVLERSPAVDHLGPDLCEPDADLDLVVSRLSHVAEPSWVLADVLLDQRIACGVGNVFKSEVCFAVGRHPATAVGALDDAERLELFATAARLLRANLGTGPRTTVGSRPGTLAVYGRARRPCRRCGTTIAVGRIGQSARSTWWCPTCQPEPATRSGWRGRSGPPNMDP
jgi:endonuclease-8